MASAQDPQLVGRPTPLPDRATGKPGGDWVRFAPGRPGFERFEAFFQGHAFDPHRHDVYCIGMTTRGVQAFGYRGGATHSLAGQLYVLHPDELHDGHAGTEIGFRYLSLYVEPGLIQEALGRDGGPDRPLPFVPEAVARHPSLQAALDLAFEDLEAPLDDLLMHQVLQDLAEALEALDPAGMRPAGPTLHPRAVATARDLLAEGLEWGVTSADLEAATGLDRYSLARQFRSAYGTSPYRYLLLRRLDRARALIQQGVPLAEAAAASGFADQSHMTRHFKKALGLSPGRWAAICAQAAA